MSTRRYSTKPPLVKGPNGRWLCRCGCLNECQPPRRTFFSDNCVHTYLLRRSGSYLRKCVRQRDRGICVNCKLDCCKLRREYRTAKKNGDSASVRRLKAAYPRFKPNRSYWEAHHIKAVADGGGELVDLGGIQTLCVACHLDATKQWHKAKVFDTVVINTLKEAKTPDT